MQTSVMKGKKDGGARLWMRFDHFGGSNLIECDKNAIIRRAAIPARDLRILEPVISHSSSILEQVYWMVEGKGKGPKDALCEVSDSH
ncbi:hypothetical protein DVH24_016363 [Malus domestica]|uniref:Uncharacterized protein n=1 Tax=Malus domestica TaxID=3750 RepID=A0A498HWJ8_MALDO|nr:hypothetical protein DVH24_016363 [Malus domestica]